MKKITEDALYFCAACVLTPVLVLAIFLVAVIDAAVGAICR